MKKTNIIIYFLLFFLYLCIYTQNYEITYILVTLILATIALESYSTKKIKKQALHVNDTNDQQIYLDAFENSGIYAKLDSNHSVIYANRQFCQIMYVTKLEAHKINLLSLMKSSKNEIYETIKYKQSWEGTKIFLNMNKENVFLNCSFIPIFHKNDTLKEILFLATDITELTMSKTNVKNSLYQDSLTKLPNRLKLFTDKNTKSSCEETTHILINIDSFDSINNLYGNAFGDKILIQVAHWLQDNLLSEETELYKLEADIYSMVCFHKVTPDHLLSYLVNLTKKISEYKFHCDETEIDVSLTIGASQGKTKQQKLSQIAYKEAKLANKSFSIYDKNSNKEEEYTKNIQTSKTLKNAFDKDLIIPYFQPILNIQSNKIEKYETLMRIQNEEGKILFPFEFLDIAKRSKVYPKISRKLIQKSIETFQISPCEFSVNLSFLDINNTATTKFILQLLEETGIGPWIIFELLESEGIENYKDVMKFIEQVKSYGARIAIDDFGSGYSNFERLLELNVDFIKIDGSLIKNIDQNDDMKVITKTIVNFAKELRIKTVAEYVHSEEVLNEIKLLGVDFAQGFHIGKPERYF